METSGSFLIGRTLRFDDDEIDRVKLEEKFKDVPELPNGLTIIETDHEMFYKGLVAIDKNDERYVLKKDPETKEYKWEVAA